MQLNVPTDCLHLCATIYSEWRTVWVLRKQRVYDHIWSRFQEAVPRYILPAIESLSTRCGQWNDNFQYMHSWFAMSTIARESTILLSVMHIYLSIAMQTLRLVHTTHTHTHFSGRHQSTFCLCDLRWQNKRKGATGRHTHTYFIYTMNNRRSKQSGSAWTVAFDGHMHRLKNICVSMWVSRLDTVSTVHTDIGSLEIYHVHNILVGDFIEAVHIANCYWLLSFMHISAISGIGRYTCRMAGACLSNQ